MSADTYEGAGKKKSDQRRTDDRSPPIKVPFRPNRINPNPTSLFIGGSEFVPKAAAVRYLPVHINMLFGYQISLRRLGVGRIAAAKTVYIFGHLKNLIFLQEGTP